MALGAGAGYNATTGLGNVYIGQGMSGVAGESNATYISGIYDQAIDPGSFFMGVDVNHKLGTHAASGSGVRIKDVVEDHNKIVELEATVAALTTQLKEQATRIERMNVALKQ